MNFSSFYRKHTLYGRIFSVASWFALIALLLLGGAVGTAADSELAGILLCIPGVIIYCLLQSLSTKAEDAYTKKLQNENNPRNDLSEQKFSSSNRSEEKNMQKDREKLVQKSMDCLHKLLPEKMPVSGKCASVAVQFAFPQTDNVAYIEAACDAVDPHKRRIIIRIVRSGHDMCMMNYMMHGTMNEIMDYLADSAHVVPLMNALQHLSDRIDEKL